MQALASRAHSDAAALAAHEAEGTRDSEGVYGAPASAPAPAPATAPALPGEGASLRFPGATAAEEVDLRDSRLTWPQPSLTLTQAPTVAPTLTQRQSNP